MLPSGLSQQQKGLHQWLLSDNMDPQQWLLFQQDYVLDQDKQAWLNYVIISLNSVSHRHEGFLWAFVAHPRLVE